MLALPSIRFLSNKQCVKSGKRDLVKFNDPFLVLVQVALLIVAGIAVVAAISKLHKIMNIQSL